MVYVSLFLWWCRRRNGSIGLRLPLASPAMQYEPQWGGHGRHPLYMEPMVKLHRHRWLHLERLVYWRMRPGGPPNTDSWRVRGYPHRQITNPKISGPEILWNSCHGECHSVSVELPWRPLTVIDSSSTTRSLPRFLLHGPQLKKRRRTRRRRMV